MQKKGVYLRYFSFDEKAYQEKIQYFESIFDELPYVQFEERIEMQIDYLLCIFEIGLYHKFLRNIDPVIETIIIENMYEYKGEDMYPILLFRKAASLYHIKQFDKAIKILKQLKSIDPKTKIYEEVIILSIKKKMYKTINITNGIIYLNIAMVFGLAIAQLFADHRWIIENHSTLTLIRWILLSVSLAIIIGIEFYIRLYSKYYTTISKS
ncbi:MAG: hypothetical protein R2774_07300 [Saprospiraceae bacterium]